MAEILTIDKNNLLPNAQDYHFLRKQGIKSIQDLAGKVWTDYNTHDPGITLLEVLCFALTDLGYRTSFEMPDILASLRTLTANDWKKLIYTAHDILPCNPLTLVDYRKLIIDTAGVRNAWVEISDEYETLMYLQKIQQNKQTDPPYALTYDSRDTNDVLYLRGLYKVFVEYEEDVKDPQKVEDEIWKKLRSHRNLTEDFYDVSPIQYEDFDINSIIQVGEGVDIVKINAQIYKVIYDFFSPPVRFYTLAEMLEKDLSPEEIFEGPVLNYGFIDTAELEKSDRFKNIHLSDIINLISSIEGVMAVKKFVFASDVKYTYSNFTEWINDIKDNQKIPRLDIDKSIITFERSGDRHRTDEEKRPNIDQVKRLYNFLKKDSLKKKLLGSEKDLLVPPGEFMDIEKYYPFQKNLPTVYGMHESFTNNSDFIDKATVDKAEYEVLVEKVGVHGAELIDRLLKYKKYNRAAIEKMVLGIIKGEPKKATSVRAVLNEALDDTQLNYDDLGEKITKKTLEEASEKLMIRLFHELLKKDAGYQPQREELYRYVEENPAYNTPSKKALLLQKLASNYMKGKTLHEINEPGEIAELDSLYRLHQVDMLDKDKKLVLQLRGFLMIFEQMLADYLSKLAHIREIFSFDSQDRLTQTFYTQVIDEIEDIETLFINFRDYKEFHIKLLETPESFSITRNKILDHLLARFAESMDNYAFFMNVYAGKQAGGILIDDKIDFLTDYIGISNYRGQGYNYGDPGGSWNSNNVEGLKKRICRLLGISARDMDTKNGKPGSKNYNRKKIATEAVTIKEIKIEQGVERWVVALTDPEDYNVILLSTQNGVNRFEDDLRSRPEAVIILNHILENGNNPDYYSKIGSGQKWQFVLKKETPEDKYETVASSNIFSTMEERDKVLEKTIQVLKDLSEDENFHIIEHILLRPGIGVKSTEPDQSPPVIKEVLLLPPEGIPEHIKTSGVSSKEYRYKFRILHNPAVTGTKEQGYKPISRRDKKEDHWKLSLMKNNLEFLKVSDDFVIYKHVARRMNHIREFAADRVNYVTEPKDRLFTYKIKDNKKILAESSKNYRNVEDMEKDIQDLIMFMSSDEDFLTSPTDTDTAVFYADPYSFQVSFILPSWQKKFRDITFKHLMEKTIYLETPSHIYPHVYWLDHDEMRHFEKAYEIWVNEMTAKITNKSFPSEDIVNEMIKALINLRTSPDV